MNGCVLCNLYRPENIIYENDHAFAVLSPTPIVPGQLLIMPNRHVLNVHDLGLDEKADFLIAVDESYRALVKKFYDERNSNGLLNFYKRTAAEHNLDSARESCNRLLSNDHIGVIPVGYNFGGNIGKVAGQSQEHAHLHLFPRRPYGEPKGLVEAMRLLLSQ